MRIERSEIRERSERVQSKRAKRDPRVKQASIPFRAYFGTTYFSIVKYVIRSQKSETVPKLEPFFSYLTYVQKTTSVGNCRFPAKMCPKVSKNRPIRQYANHITYSIRLRRYVSDAPFQAEYVDTQQSMVRHLTWRIRISYSVAFVIFVFNNCDLMVPN